VQSIHPSRFKATGREQILEVHILGKCNSTLSYKLDALYERYRSSCTINIVQNIPTAESPPYRLQVIKDFEFNILNDNEWNGEFENLIMGVTGPLTMKKVYDSFLKSHNIQESDYFTFYHPSAVVSKQTEIGTGVFIGPGSIIAPYVSLGNLVTINRKVSVGHHTNIGKFVVLHPGCNIGGASTIGDYTSIGMGANIINSSSIGENTIIGAGSLVTKSIPDNVIAYGVPARIMRDNEN
jgi:sugar O-acyltransferase (sialic acid O-acetyltransferase NeuD family)